MSKLLAAGEFPKLDKKEYETELERLQLCMLRVEQAAWKSKHRVIIALEGFDSAGKGGLIRRMTEHLDPRGAIVHPIAAPSEDERTRHYLYRFWTRLPKAGTIAIFDRTWYGRVLVERVEGFAKKSEWQRAFDEINAFEKMLIDDGVPVLKLFLAISKDEQLSRFEERLKDPYKQWKLTKEDLRNRDRWDDYVEAVDEMFERTHTELAPWHLIPANDKRYARIEGLRVIEQALEDKVARFRKEVEEHHALSLKEALKELGLKQKDLE